MAKLIKILAASVGSGLVLGAGIRLGEAIAAWEPAVAAGPGGKLADKLNAIENRLSQIEAGAPAQSRPVVLQNEANLYLRTEIKGWMEESVAARMAEVETRLKAESDAGQKHVLDALVDTVQTRVMSRITRLEEEVANQSTAMNELRECSLRTERSVQKLLGGLDKLIVRNASDAGVTRQTAEAPQQPAPEQSLQNEPNPEPRRPARWHLFK